MTDELNQNTTTDPGATTPPSSDQSPPTPPPSDPDATTPPPSDQSPPTTPPETNGPVMPPVDVEMALRKIASEVAYATGMATGNAHDLLTGQTRGTLSPERQRRIAELALSDTPGRHALIREIIVEHNCECSAKDIRDAKPRVEKG